MVAVLTHEQYDYGRKYANSMRLSVLFCLGETSAHCCIKQRLLGLKVLDGPMQGGRAVTSSGAWFGQRVAVKKGNLLRSRRSLWRYEDALSVSRKGALGIAVGDGEGKYGLVCDFSPASSIHKVLGAQRTYV